MAIGKGLHVDEYLDMSNEEVKGAPGLDCKV